ncbi:helix-turn-helix domain-containing protein [Nocardia iowensis]|uniref:Helix-turn-helix transcriptional regulator n=1 Tax=Nocardia iowensis TaxID=204891 RepID=A0ABX8RYK9_NOCIO|nr:helix-turn-helix transcriptional regulator [Nocardia iowensis]QXN94743.1 helix-turn-helix transcriptional regulator [Nocardia iowensis]
MNTPSQTSTVDEAVRAFAAEVTYWRETNGLDKKALADQMGFDPSYVSHIESRRHKPTEDFARKADVALNAGHAIVRRWREYEVARKRMPRPSGDLAPAPTLSYPGVDLVVEHDAARLDYDGSTYRPTMRRLVRNTGTEPITRYLIRVSVDRYPSQPDRSKIHYRQNPLTWDELGLSATCQDEPMRWEVKHDMDSCKEAWLLFENDNGKFPLYPGQSVWITYNYSVGDNKWGHWFQRAVRLPTQRLEVQLAFPSALDPVVWGTETSMTADARPIPTAPTQHEEGDVAVFAWNTTHPPLHTRYRMEWRFRSQPENTAQGREFS